MKLLERRATASDGRESAIEPTAAALAIGDQLKAASGEISKRMKSELGLAHFEDAVSQVRNIRSTLA
jgi:hypothetical protein